MQATDADKNIQRCRDGELMSSFRPSQSFIHIKYLKSKVEEGNSPSKSGGDGVDSHSPGPEDLDKVKSAKPIQPPLPPNSPPPDIPLVVSIKQEVTEESNGVSEEVSESNQSMESTTEPSASSSDQSPGKPKMTMCRNFVRGTCTRKSACIFSHKLDISQLKGVYTFCKNFQNRVCTLPTCKFVHATVFEKENFFRTGYLPPHTLAHLKQVQIPPPPPPPEDPPPPSPPPFFRNPPPVNVNNGAQPILTPVPILPCQHSVALKPNPEIYAVAANSSLLSTVTTPTTTMAVMSTTTTSLKRNRSEMTCYATLKQNVRSSSHLTRRLPRRLLLWTKRLTRYTRSW